MAGALRTSTRSSGAISGTLEAMAISTQLERDSKARDSRARGRAAIKVKAKERQQASMDNVTRAANMDILRGFVLTAITLGSQRAKERIRQSVTIAAMRVILQPTAQKGRAKTQQPIG